MMKKTYVKPALALESFVLSQSIASTCTVPGGGTELGKPGHSSNQVCGWEVDGIVVWLDTGNICDYGVSENTQYEGVCYNTPKDGLTIFGS